MVATQLGGIGVTSMEFVNTVVEANSDRSDYLGGTKNIREVCGCTMQGPRVGEQPQVQIAIDGNV